MTSPIYITGAGCMSAAGCTPIQILGQAQSAISPFTQLKLNNESYPVGLIADSEPQLQAAMDCYSPRRMPDRSVLMALAAARQAIAQAGWHTENTDICGVNVGTSRGLTHWLETAHTHHIQGEALEVITSPYTSMGQLSTELAAKLSLNGPQFNHSITCSSATYAIANAVAWMRAGMADRFLAGGAEAPVTSFTMAQLLALKIYTNSPMDDLPCRPFSTDECNGLVLSEAAALFTLEKEDGAASRRLARIEAIGYGNEGIPSPAGMSENAICIQNAMKTALSQLNDNQPPDLIIAHGTGTSLGDQAELRAIQTIFPDNSPAILSTKFFTGHSLGASAGLSLYYAILILNQNAPVSLPYDSLVPTSTTKKPVNRIMINSAGFGGVAGSIIISR